MVVPHLKKNGK